ncbi:hypothetical protein ABFS82_14G119800 [Erythranthe guttata]
MEKMVYTTLIFFSIVVINLQIIHGNNAINCMEKDPKSIQKWFEKNLRHDPKVTNLHFYLHDIVSGPTPTNVPIVISNSTAKSPTFFGLVAAIDDPLTAGPDPDSEKVGRAQGLLASTSLEETSYHMSFNIVFTNEKYNGSTLTIVGANPFLHEYRELAVVGGSGVFRLARGSAVLKTLTYNATSGNAIVEYNVEVLHY